MTQAILSGAAIGALYVLMSIGFALSLEIADIVNAAHGVFVVGGMYLTLEMVRKGIPLYVAAVLAGVVVAAVSLPLYTLLIRSARAERGHRIQLVYTLLILSMLTAIYQLIFGADLQTLGTQSASVQILGGFLTIAQIVALVLAVVISVSLYLVAKYTMTGKLAYVASRYPLGARSLGVPVDRIYGSVFVLAGFLAGLAGGVLMSFQPVEPTLGLQYTVVVFLVALVSRTHLIGCLALGLAYGIVQSILSYLLNPTLGATLTLVVFLVALIAERAVTPVRRLIQRVAAGSPQAVSETS
jgi:branched-chain amino acid transport system permease protein